MFDVSIIIVNWNVKNYLRKCLNSIYSETKRLSFEIIVVDNASTDGSAEMLGKEFPQVILIKNDENVGFSKANNQAIKIAQSKYILLLNPDTLILDEAIEKLYRFIEDHRNVVAVGPTILNADGGTIQYDCARTIPSLWNEFCWLSELSLHFKESRFFSYITLDYWDHKDSRYIDLLSGSCMLCKTSIVREINFLDEDYFLYADDVDFCFRIRQKGKIYYLADAKIIHYGGQSSKQVDNNLWLLRCESTRIFFKKNRGRFYSSGYRQVVVLSQIIKIIFITISSMKHSSYPLKKNLIQCWTLIMWAIKRTRKPFTG